MSRQVTWYILEIIHQLRFTKHGVFCCILSVFVTEKAYILQLTVSLCSFTQFVHCYVDGRHIRFEVAWGKVAWGTLTDPVACAELYSVP